MLEDAALYAYAQTDIAELAGGYVQLLTSGDVVLRTFALGTPPASRAGAVLTVLGVPIVGTGSGSGVAAKATFFKAGGAPYNSAVAVGVPGSGAPVIVDNGSGSLSIGTIDSVRLLSATITHS